MFIVGSELAGAIYKLTKSGKADCAVAFWGDGAERMFRKSKAYAPRIICNLGMGGTNPKIIRRLLDLTEIRHCDTLHAKIYLGSDRAIVTSANASTNGLGIDGASPATWIEAGYLTTDVAPIRIWFEALWASSSEVTEADLCAAEAAWAARQKTVAHPLGASHNARPTGFEELLPNGRRTSGRDLNRQWSVGAQHALYRRDGTWYHWLKRFPAALFDANGYVRFETKDDLLECSGLSGDEDKNWLNVSSGIASLPGYVRVQES